MADYLSRLIQRVNGQAPVVRPLIRSGYGTLSLLNESITEFEETVTFNDDTETEQSSEVLQTKNGRPDVTSQPDTRDISKPRVLIETNEEPEVEMTSDVLAEPALQESKLTRGRAQENRKPVFSAKENNRTRNDAVIVPDEPQADSPKNANDGERFMQVFNRHSLVFREKPIETTPQPGDMPEADVSPPLSAIGRTESERTNAVENTPEIRRLISPDIELPETYFSEEAGIIRPNEQIYPVNSAGQHRSDGPSPSVNVRVSIGRIEVKSAEEAEPEPRHIPSVPVGPEISLDAYLKNRGEEGR